MCYFTSNLFILQWKWESSVDAKGILGISTDLSKDGHCSVSIVLAFELKNLASAEKLRRSSEEHANDDGDAGERTTAKWCTVEEMAKLEKIQMFDCEDLSLGEKFAQGELHLFANNLKPRIFNFSTGLC